MRRYTLFLYFFLVVCCNSLLANESEGGGHESDNRSTNTKTKESVSKLRRTAVTYFELGNEKAKDSIFEIVLENLKAENNHCEMINAYVFYFEQLATFQNKAMIDKRAADMLTIANSCNEMHCLSLAHAMLANKYLRNGQTQLAVNEANSAVRYANRAENDTRIRVSSLLILGDSYDRNKDKIEAFRQYSEANILALKADNDSLLGDCYDHFSRFYYQIENFDSATVYKKRELELYGRKHPESTPELMKLKMELAGCYFKSQQPIEAEQILTEVILYARRNNLNELKSNAFQFFRNYYIETGNLSALAHLYLQKYPEEWLHIKQNDSSLYYRVAAFSFDANKQNDSASIYYQKAISSIGDNNPYLLTFLLLHYAHFLENQGQTNEAIVQYKKSYYNSTQAFYLPFMLRITHKLDSLYKTQSNYDSAYYYRDLYDQNYIKWIEVTKSDDLLRQSLKSTAEVESLLQEKEQLRIDAKHEFQYTTIVLSLLILFIILCVLGSFRVHRNVIKATNFIAFIFLFEFIVLIAEEFTKNEIHGEPWKTMLFKIVLIGLLSPLHHWIEEKVLHYLYTHNLVDNAKVSIGSIFRNFKSLFNSIKRKKPTDNEFNLKE